MTEHEFTSRAAQARKQTEKYVLIVLASMAASTIAGMALLNTANERHKIGDKRQDVALQAGFFVFFIGGFLVGVPLAAWTPYRIARKLGMRCPKCGRLWVLTAPKVTKLTGKCAWCGEVLFEIISPPASPDEISATEKSFRQRRNAAREDTPILCALFGALAAAFSLASFTDHYSEMGDDNRMESFSGKAASIVHTTDRIKSRSTNLLQIEIVNGGRRRYFVQFDGLCKKLPALNELRVGDSIVAVGKDDSLRPGRIWLYEIHVGQTTLISYAQTVSALHHRAKMMGYVGGCISFVLLLFGLALRMRFGAWMLRMGGSGSCSAATDQKPIQERRQETLHRKSPETKG